ncbi:hypothetical protein [Nonomuraea solani]|uniref:hypothetical protein n=1 Tax=Nonomuraea solani TaxID=1144553 RepID=UPI0011B07BBA|nr:hypothetical protein [Nonomuraea solani]
MAIGDDRRSSLQRRLPATGAAGRSPATADVRPPQGGRLAVEAIDDLEVHPARHRRNVIWQY